MAFVENTSSIVEYTVPGPIVVLRSRRHRLRRQQVKLKQRARAGAHTCANAAQVNCSFTLKIWCAGVGEAAFVLRARRALLSSSYKTPITLSECIS